MGSDFLSNFAYVIVASLRMATPMLLASIGLVLAARAGLSNLGTEGVMLMGAFMSAVGSYLTGSAWVGIFLAVFSGILLELFVSVLVINVRASQIIVAMATNLLAQGITSSYGRVIFGLSTEPPPIQGLPNIPIPLLCNIPIVGDVVFNNNILFYLAYVMVPVASYILYKTSWGLKIRYVGENPKAADTLGVDVYMVRRVSCVLRGVFASLAGAYLTLGVIGMFTENMIAGKGYMSVAVTIFGKWTPIGAMLGSLLFGLGETLQMRLQAIGLNIPYQLLQSFPYIITLIILTGVAGKAKQPAATGEAYIKD